MVVEELVEGGLTRLAVFYYSDIARERRSGPLDARQRHRHRLAGARPIVTSGAAGRHDRAGSRPPASRSTARARRASTARPTASRRTTCSPTSTRSPRIGQDGEARTPPTTCRGATRQRLPEGPEGDHASRRQFSGGHTTEWTFTNGELPQHQQQRRRPATSSRPTTCWCCGSRSATPATSTRPATRCRRPSSTGKGDGAALPRRPVVRGTWQKGKSRPRRSP